MANEIAVPTAGPVLSQRIAIAMVKAGLSTIPFASLAWDVASASLEFFNDHASDSFLDELTKRIEALEREAQPLGRTAQAAAHEALQQLTFERSDSYARDLAGAVAALEIADFDERLLSQVALAIGKMNSRFVVYLGAINRIESGRPTSKEVDLVGCVEPFPKGTFGDEDRFDILHSIEYVLSHHYPSVGIHSDLEAMRSIGLITLPAVRIISGAPEPWAQTPVHLTDLGRTVLNAFSDDPDKVPSYSDLA